MPRILHTPRGEVEIRAAQMDDLQAFRTLRLQALHDHPEAFSADYELHSREEGGEFWKKYLAFGEAAILYLACHDSDLVGMTGIRRDSGPKTRHNATIWGVYVRPDWRGQGISDVLIESCCAWARETGVTIARLGVTTTNQSAIHCYERCGFQITGTDPQAIFVNGRYYDEYLMARIFD